MKGGKLTLRRDEVVKGGIIWVPLAQPGVLLCCRERGHKPLATLL